jgi:hypothetical protein
MAALHWVSCSPSQRLYKQRKSSFSLWLVLKKLPTLACFACLLACLLENNWIAILFILLLRLELEHNVKDPLST